MAQESAATSQEISERSVDLVELISQFKLRGGNTGKRSLNAAGYKATGTPQPEKHLTIPERVSNTTKSNTGDFGKY